MKNDIKILFNKMELINDNSSIYYDDSSNNYKEFYIEYLITMNEKIKQSEKFSTASKNIARNDKKSFNLPTLIESFLFNTRTPL